jgi:hypothetical protein
VLKVNHFVKQGAQKRTKASIRRLGEGARNQEAIPTQAIVPFTGIKPTTLSKTDQTFPNDIDERVKFFDNLTKSSPKPKFPKNIWEQMDKVTNHKGKTFDKEGLEILQPINKIVRQELGTKSSFLLAANRNVRPDDGVKRSWITRYDTAPNLKEIGKATNFKPTEIRLIRTWLISQGLIFLNSRIAFWHALDYFIGINLIESFSIDAVESAVGELAVYYGSNTAWAEQSREAYGSLKIVRAIRQQRDLQLKAKKLELIRSRIPGLDDQTLNIFKKTKC